MLNILQSKHETAAVVLQQAIQLSVLLSNKHLEIRSLELLTLSLWIGGDWQVYSFIISIIDAEFAKEVISAKLF